MLSANATGYAVADYMARRPGSRVITIGEVKTGDARLSPNQLLNYGNGIVQILGTNAASVGLVKGEMFPASYIGVDRFPGCPE